jgi:hypothetical protein
MPVRDEEVFDRQSTLSERDIELMARMFDAAGEKFHGDVRLAGKDLTRAKKLAQPPLQMTQAGRLSEKHYALSEKGRDFIVGFRRRSRSR